MRKILFRGKAFFNGEWAYGSLVKVQDECVIIPEDAVYYGGSDFSDGWGVDPNTVGQFTGQKDKNGVRIFEGDIVKAETHDYKGDMFQGAVIFKDGCFCIEYHPWDEYLNDFSSRKITHRIAKETLWHDTNTSGIMRYTYEVVGNIHDVPEKLEAKK